MISILQRGLDDHRAGRLQAAEASYREVLATDPDNPDALHLLGVIELDRGELQSALARLGRAIELDGSRGEFHSNLGNALKLAGRLDEALGHYRQALRLTPLSPEIRNNLGAALLGKGDFQQAAATLRSAIALRRDYGEAHYNLGTVLGHLDRYLEAVAALRVALTLLPGHAGAWTNLGFALHNQGEAVAAVVAFRRAVLLRPHDPGARANLICAVRLLEGIGLAEELAECAEFERRFAIPLAGALAPPRRGGDPERRLRVGYIGVDGLRLHTASVTILPLMEAHDKARFETVCYSDLPKDKEDKVTARYRAAASEFRITQGLDHQALAERIRADGIDIAVDIIGYPGGSRLLTLARRPAPVAVNLLLMGTFGLSTVDWAITDDILTPQGSDRWFCERLYRLPVGFCYDPLVETPDPAPVPSADGRPTVFASLNQPAKLSPATIETWSEILRRAPGSRLLLRGRAFSDAGVAERVRQAFARRGIEPERIELRGWAGSHGHHLAIYGEIDIALDPFPYGGVITTCEALWSGVPVVSLRGERVLGRYGSLLLSAVGEPDLAASTREDYVSRAVELSRDIDRLRTLRSTLRARMRASPLCDGATFARAMESGYRAMWRDWCQGS